MTPETAAFLLDLLNRLTVPAGDPSFEDLVAKIIKAQKELTKLAESTTTN